MSDRWATFVASAITPPADDPFVRVLRERLSSGCRVVRASLAPSERPEYAVILDCHKQLSEMRVPHSASFTRWSLENGVRMASVDDEARRFSVLFDERFAPVETELGRDYFRALLVQYVRSLGAPRTIERLGTHREYGLNPGASFDRAQRAVEQVFLELARALGESLRYSKEESAAILDAALGDSVGRVLRSPLAGHLGLSESGRSL